MMVGGIEAAAVPHHGASTTASRSLWHDLAPRADERLESLQKKFTLIRIIEDLVLWENTTNEAVLQRARDGFEPADRETEKLGYDIESRVPGTGKLRFIEVKGRVAGAETITVTRNEILYSLNKPDDFILAMVEFLDGETHRAHYQPDFHASSVNYDFAELIARADAPR